MVLGVPFGSPEAEVRKAYRRLVSVWHPDKNDSAEAHAKTQKLNLAFSAIEKVGFAPPSSPDHDQSFHYQDEDWGSSSYGGTYGRAESYYDYGYPHTKKARSISRKVKLTLEEAAFGCIREFKGKTGDVCPSCKGDKVTGRTFQCPSCKGRGYVDRDPYYYYSGRTCHHCSGHGQLDEPCPQCAGTGNIGGRPYSFKVNLPPGVHDGDKLYARGVGGIGSDGVTRSDARITIEVEKHSHFFFDDDKNLAIDLPVTMFEVMRRATVEVPTLYGIEKLTLDPSKYHYFLDEAGFPDRHGTPGQLHVLLHLHVPDASAPELADLLIKADAILFAKNGEAERKHLARKAFVLGYAIKNRR